MNPTFWAPSSGRNPITQYCAWVDPTVWSSCAIPSPSSKPHILSVHYLIDSNSYAGPRHFPRASRVFVSSAAAGSSLGEPTIRAARAIPVISSVTGGVSKEQEHAGFLISGAFSVGGAFLARRNPSRRSTKRSLSS